MTPIRWALLALTLSVLVLLALGCGTAYAVEKPEILEVISLSGEVSGAWATQLDTLREQMEGQSNVKGLLIVMDSPGGGVLETQSAYDSLAKFKKPVVVWCDNVCASGGIYIPMSPSVKFLAMRDITISGSIGVRMTVMRANRLLDWAKIDIKTYKSGELKDSGDPTRAETPADSAYLQGIVEHLAGKFYSVVQKGRPNIKIDQVKSARIVFGEEAVKIGLADAVMDKEQAIAKAKSLSGAKFTREELKKMAKAAEAPDSTSYTLRQPEPNVLDSLSRSMDEFTKAYRELRSGGAVTVDYLMPIKF